MAEARVQTSASDSVVSLPISETERSREAALRKQFSAYWSNAHGEPRAIFDAFIATTPSADDASSSIWRSYRAVRSHSSTAPPFSGVPFALRRPEARSGIVR
jgi:hypothetical protein